MIQRIRKVEGHFRSDVFLAFLIRKGSNVVVNLIVRLGALAHNCRSSQSFFTGTSSLQLSWIDFPRHLEIRLPVSGLACYPPCHPSLRSGSGSTNAEILRCAQDDKHYLQMSRTSLSPLSSRASSDQRGGRSDLFRTPIFYAPANASLYAWRVRYAKGDTMNCRRRSNGAMTRSCFA